jgi:hypothetical protein
VHCQSENKSSVVLFDRSSRTSGVPAALTSGNVYQGTLLTYTGGETLTGPFQSPSGTTSAGTITIQFASPTSGTLTLPDGKQIPTERYGF